MKTICIDYYLNIVYNYSVCLILLLTIYIYSIIVHVKILKKKNRYSGQCSIYTVSIYLVRNRLVYFDAIILETSRKMSGSPSLSTRTGAIAQYLQSAYLVTRRIYDMLSICNSISLNRVISFAYLDYYCCFYTLYILY